MVIFHSYVSLPEGTCLRNWASNDNVVVCYTALKQDDNWSGIVWAPYECQHQWSTWSLELECFTSLYWCLAKFLEDSLAPSTARYRYFVKLQGRSRLRNWHLGSSFAVPTQKNGWFKNLISITWVLWSCSCSGVFKWRWCKWQENVWRIYQYLNSIKKQCKLRIGPHMTELLWPWARRAPMGKIYIYIYIYIENMSYVF